MSISVLLILGIAMAIFIVKDGMNKFQAVVAVLFGIYLAETTLGGNLQQWTDGLFDIIGNINF